MHPNRDTRGAKRIPCKLHPTKLVTAAEQQLRNAFSLCSSTRFRCPEPHGSLTAMLNSVEDCCKLPTLLNIVEICQKATVE
jgi:hypothetical protein